MKSPLTLLPPLLLALVAHATEIGKPAPAFSLTDTQGKSHKLSDFAGKTVVLEWVNYDCPFVKKHYGANNMQTLQKKWKEKGVVWLAVNSSAQGKQGNFVGDALLQRIAQEKAAHTAYLLDTDGVVGKAYGAKTTPHMYIITPDGNLVYNGAIDNKPSTDPADIASATNYVDQALAALAAGKPVPLAESKPYGCSVKY